MIIFDYLIINFSIFEIDYSILKKNNEESVIEVIDSMKIFNLN